MATNQNQNINVGSIVGTIVKGAVLVIGVAATVYATGATLRHIKRSWQPYHTKFLFLGFGAAILLAGLMIGPVSWGIDAYYRVENYFHTSHTQVVDTSPLGITYPIEADASIRNLVDSYWAGARNCANGEDYSGCDKEEAADNLLTKFGYCLGHGDQAEYEKQWEKCR